MARGREKLAGTISAAEQLAIVKETQTIFGEDIPYVSFGDTFQPVALREDVEGAETNFGMPFNVYNTWRG